MSRKPPAETAAAEPVAPTPIVVNPKSSGEQAASAMRSAIILLGGLTTLLGLLRTHDIAGLVVFLQSTAALPFLGAVSAIGAFLYGQWRIIVRKREARTMAAKVDDSVAVLQTPAPKG